MTPVPRVALQDVATIERDMVEPYQIKSGTLFVGLENIESGGRFVDVRPVESGELASSKFAFTSRHVLYGKLRPYLAKIARPNFEGICSTDILPVLPGPELDRGYLSWLLLTPEMVSLATSRATGANLPRLSPSALAEMRIPFPPLCEQRRIAEILDKADALRAKRRAALAQLDTLTQSIFLDMFGDPATILAMWPIANLGELLDFLTSGSRGWAEYYSPDGELFLRIQNVKRDELSLDDVVFVRAPDTAEARRTRVQPGDVLLSITADLGRTAVVPEGLGPAFINQHLAILRTNALVPHFLSSYLASPIGQQQVSNRNRHGVKAGLNFDDIRSLVVPVPPSDLQHEFRKQIAAAQSLERTQRSSVTGLDALFVSLQHRAFRGEL
jgi:type I restriction enzyme S subunit